MVLIARCPLWRFAADAGGHTPRAPAWMCIACLPSTSPCAATVTVRVVPSRRMAMSPAPVTWFIGTGPSAPLSLSPAGSAAGGFVAGAAAGGGFVGGAGRGRVLVLAARGDEQDRRHGEGSERDERDPRDAAPAGPGARGRGRRRRGRRRRGRRGLR